MFLVFYYVMFAISLVLVVVYSFIFHKHFDTNLTIISILVPIINMGFVLMGRATIIEEALIALRLTYLGGCFLLIAGMFLVFNVCGLSIKPWVRMVIVLISTAIYLTTLTIGYNDIFYVGVPELAYAHGAAYITNKHYGFMHTIFYIMVAIYYLITIGAIVYSFIKKKQISRIILFLVTICITISMIGFFGGRLFTHELEILPATYSLAMVIYLIIASRLRLYNASDSVIDSLVQKGETGFISFDNKLRYLNSNETAKKIIPELNDLVVDHRINKGSWLGDNFLSMVEEFEKDPLNNKKNIERDNKHYEININRLITGRLHSGYQFYIVDDTENQQHIKLIENYNDELEKEVIHKTKHIVEMHDQLVLAMATMVEGRDNSTGGHIKRTSDAIRIIVEEIQKDNKLGLDDKFCSDLIKAAPMHDLGKIAVDDAILRKPGRYTPEEFEKMKAHAAEGARIVGDILNDPDNMEFRKIAVNVAHYHHERWDGSGYPEGLKGEEIPLEARIMAIADVYDALVSKRVYKEKMSFEEADKIIMDGMGKHFDKQLEIYYVRARPKLEKYYSSLE